MIKSRFNKEKNTVFVLLGIFLLFLAQCSKVEKIEKVGTVKPSLVVNCIAEDGEFFKFDVSKSLSALDNASIKSLKNATIKLYLDGIFLEEIKYNSISGGYYSNATAIAGKTYMIEASSPGLKGVSASTTVPEPSALLSGNVVIKARTRTVSIYNVGSGMDTFVTGTFSNGSVDFSFKDKANEKNGYLFTVIPKWTGGMTGSYYENILWNAAMPGLETVYSFDRSSSLAYYYLNDALYDGKLITVKLKVDESGGMYSGSQIFRNNDDSIINLQVDLYTLTEDLFQHDYTARLFASTSGDIFQQPVQVFSNVKNGFGVFGGRGLSTLNIKFP